MRLTRFPDDLVKRAIRYSNILSDALHFAAIMSNPLQELPPEPRRTDAPPPAAVQAHDDSSLRKRIGPVQNYDDDL